MKTFQTIEAVATIKGMAKHTYNRVMSAMAEDTTAAMLHTFATLTDGAKAIVLQSGKFSNLYIRGERKGMTAEEAAKELAERAAGCVTRKLRKIDIVCAVAFLAEYISRQRKAEETPETPSPEPNNTPNVSDLARWIDLQLSTITEGISSGYTLGNYNSVWIDKSSTVFNVSLANGETVEIDSDKYNTAEEIATAILSALNETTPPTKNRTTMETTTPAAKCLTMYLDNTAEIYDRYTVPAINAVVEAVRRNGWQLPKDEAIKNLTFWTSWQPGTKKALHAAARLVRKYNHLTPTAQDIEQVTRNYAAYIIESATFEIKNA